MGKNTSIAQRQIQAHKNHLQIVEKDIDESMSLPPVTPAVTVLFVSRHVGKEPVESKPPVKERLPLTEAYKGSQPPASSKIKPRKPRKPIPPATPREDEILQLHPSSGTVTGRIRLNNKWREFSIAPDSPLHVKISLRGPLPYGFKPTHYDVESAIKYLRTLC